MNWLVKLFESAGPYAAWCFVALFLASSFLLIWRLEAMSARGLEGTVLGTLVMPYCSGMGNLIFAFVMGAKNGPGQEVLTNSLVNNLTNLTLILGLPAIFWRMSLLPDTKAKSKGKAKRKDQAAEHHVYRLSLLLTITAALFFTGALYVLGRDRRLDFTDGVVLVGLFLFWQCFHVFEVLKKNAQENKYFNLKVLVDLALLAAGSYAMYISIDWLVDWISKARLGFIRLEHLGWLSGWLMVLPNALLALYYARRGNPEVVYTSQIGDGHISIPLCVGLFALQHPMALPREFETGISLLLGAACVHFLFIALFGRLPRWMGFVLCGAYGVFLYKGLMH